MSELSGVVEAWITFLNTQDGSTLDSALAPDVVVLAYQEGPAGPFTRMEGIQQVIDWVQFPPKGRFVFRLMTLEPCGPSPDLPTGDSYLAASYEVGHTESEFTNQGQWTFTMDRGRISALLHVPNAL